jgi:LCP family protein required for cell wall assembly
VLLVIAILLVVCLVGGFLWVRSIFGGIERVDTEGQLASGSAAGGTNYLIVGSDSRAPIEGEQPGINDGEVPGGQRADTMLLMQVGSDGTKVTSIPRDLWVTRADNGQEGKINGAYNGGAPALLQTIRDNLEIPIHRYMEVDFVSFAGLVDGLGGITIDFPHPATDANSGLNVTGSGPVELNGEQALAYVRSRHYVEHIDGEQVPEGTGDLGRIVRQQRFLTAVMGKLSDTKNPISLLRAFDGATEGLRIDDDMGLFDAIRLGWRLRSGLNPETIEIPTEIGTVGSTSALFLRDDAQAVLDEFR